MCKTRSVSLKEHFQAIRAISISEPFLKGADLVAISGIDFGLEESF